MRERLRAYGLFSEIISWKLRFFVPVDSSGPTILAKLFDRWPVERIGERVAQPDARTRRIRAGAASSVGRPRRCAATTCRPAIAPADTGWSAMCRTHGRTVPCLSASLAGTQGKGAVGGNGPIWPQGSMAILLDVIREALGLTDFRDVVYGSAPFPLPPASRAGKVRGSRPIAPPAARPVHLKRHGGSSPWRSRSGALLRKPTCAGGRSPPSRTPPRCGSIPGAIIGQTRSRPPRSGRSLLPP